jgi:hypothetical protein
MELVESKPMFRWNMLPPSSGFNKPRRKSILRRQQAKSCLMLEPPLASSRTLNMEAKSNCEPSLEIQQNTQPYIPEYRTVYSHHSDIINTYIS